MSSSKLFIGLLPGEEIKPIPGLDERYSVTSTGRVFSHVYRHRAYTVELSQSTHPEGYKRVKLSAINPDSPTPVHRLVAMAFHPNPNLLPQVNHIDGNKGNNDKTNLEWVDNAGNQQHAFRTGLQTRPVGDAHPLAVLDEQQVMAIRAELRESEYPGQLEEIGNKFGVSKHCVFDIKHRRSWRHVA